MIAINDVSVFSGVRTPFYYYDMELFDKTASFAAALSAEYGIKIDYAVKANSDVRMLKKLASMGFGADCVSGNEVLLAYGCGFEPSEIMFAGVGKNDKEIYDALKTGIGSFNCESLEELSVINAMAGHLGVRANVSLRINPNIDAHTHKYVTTGLYENKFGISEHDFDAAVSLIKQSRYLDFKGLQFHIGSQIVRIDDVYALECRRAGDIVSYFENKGLEVRNIDLGGGLGIDYECPDKYPVADFRTWFSVIDSNLPRRKDQTVYVEPGRSMVAQCGSLISRVLYLKKGETKNFLIIDAGMNDLIRPALYGAYHKIENITAFYVRKDDTDDFVYDIAGPVCESSDVFGTGRSLRKSMRGDLIAIRSAGAYGKVMASGYNCKDFAPVVYSDRLSEAPVRIDYFNKNK
ncbi:MAG: diaminopimelate decarboxylase [Bacteroidales bacterium]|jgi:diaminopimelate decarboxylase|nr:diaminopimelate decarboxylase [Bacteroidales bacterium]